MQHSLNAPPPLREKVPAISPQAEQVIMRALAKDYHQRYLRIQDFADALQQASQANESFYNDQTVAAAPAIPDMPHRAGEGFFNPQAVPVVSPAVKPSPLAMDTVTTEAPNPYNAAPATPRPPMMEAPGPPPRFDPANAPYSYQGKVIPRQRRTGPIVLLMLALLVLLVGSIFWFAISRSSGNVTSTSSQSTQVPTSAGQVFPNVSGTYHGTIMNTTANVTARMSLSIQQNNASINGNFTVSQPLVGSNPFQGKVDAANHIQFTVESYNRNAPLFFAGTVHADGSLSGSYCSLGANGQCSAVAGASGRWSVAKGEGSGGDSQSTSGSRRN